MTFFIFSADKEGRVLTFGVDINLYAAKITKSTYSHNQVFSVVFSFLFIYRWSSIVNNHLISLDSIWRGHCVRFIPLFWKSSLCISFHIFIALSLIQTLLESNGHHSVQSALCSFIRWRIVVKVCSWYMKGSPNSDIEAAWAGGKDGRVIIDQFIPYIPVFSISCLFMS